MKDLKLDTNHDLAVESGDLQFVTDGTEVAQNWRVRMYWLLGEWYYNQNLGLPWLQQMFRQSVTPIQKRQLIIDTTLSTPGVVSIREFNESIEDRTGTLAMRIATEYNTLESVTI